MNSSTDRHLFIVFNIKLARYGMHAYAHIIRFNISPGVLEFSEFVFVAVVFLLYTVDRLHHTRAVFFSLLVVVVVVVVGYAWLNGEWGERLRMNPKYVVGR